jgi:hypothetical protein
MKKIFTTFALIAFAIVSFAAITVETNWQKSAATSNKPLWLDANTRGMAFAKMGENERLFVVSRHSDFGNNVYIYNAQTGDSVGKMNMGTGIVDGGFFVINEAGATADGALLVSSMALAGNAFKVYMWTNETEAPVNVINVASALGRMGDKIRVTGKISDGSARVWAATASAVEGRTQLYYFDMIADEQNPGKFVFVQTPKVFATVATNTSNPAVDIKPDGKVWFKGGGTQITEFLANGTESGKVSSSAVVAAAGNAVRYLGKDDNNDEYLAYFRYGAGQEKLNILKLPGGDISIATRIDSTAVLGTNSNGNGTGGVASRILPNGDVELFALSSNNGFGKYTVKNMVSVTSTPSVLRDDIRISIEPGLIRVAGIEISSVELISLTGQKVKLVNQQSAISTHDLQGIYILRISEKGKVVANRKIFIQ